LKDCHAAASGRAGRTPLLVGQGGQAKRFAGRHNPDCSQRSHVRTQGYRIALGKSARNILILAFAIAVAIVLAWWAWEVLLLAYASILFAVILRGISTWIFKHTRLTSKGAYVAVVLGILILCAAIIWLIAPRTINEIAQITKAIPESIALAKQNLSRQPWGRQLISAGTKMFSRLDIGMQAAHWGRNFFELISGFVVIVVVGFFLALEPSLYRNGVLRLFPENDRDTAKRLLDEIAYVLHWWLLGQLVPMVFLGIATMVGLWILNIPLAFTLGLFTGVMIFVPYLGAIISEIPAVLVALLQGPGKLIEVIILYLGVHCLEAYVLTPMMQRRAIRLPPALTIMSQVFMFSITGILGVAVATPLAATAIVMVKELYLHEDPKRSLKVG
jgi:predicted PurR-regulated permease PerM